MASIVFSTFIASLIPLSFGYFLNKFFFKGKNINLFEFGIYGFLPIGIIALIFNFFSPLSQSLNNFFLIPIFFFIFDFLKNRKFYLLLKINLLISVLVTIFISFDTVYRPDAGWYHLPFTKILNDFKIIFGTASLHPMFGVNSILQYISAVFNNSILNDKGIVLPNALIAIYFFGFFILELLKKNSNFIKKFFCFFALSYMFIEANRYSEYGNDIPGLFYFLYVIYLFLDIKKNNFSYKEIEKISLFSVFVFTIKTFLIFVFLIPLFFFIKNIKKKFFPLFALFFLITWFIKNILISGCLIYPVNFTCSNNLEWYSSNPKFQISALNSSQFTELYIKGWYNEKNIINISEDNYQNNLKIKNIFLKNFNWLNEYWLSNNFKNIIKRFDYFILLISLLILINKFILKNKFLQKNYFLNTEIKIIFLTGLVGTSVFFYKFPDGRYGASYILITLFCILINFFEKISFPDSIRRINKSLVLITLSFLCLVMITKSIVRINSNYNYINSAWPNIYDLDKPNNYKTNFDFVEKNGTKIFFSSSDNLKIVHKNLCAYNKAPCTPTKNYLNQFDIKKNNFGYLILKLNK